MPACHFVQYFMRFCHILKGNIGDFSFLLHLKAFWGCFGRFLILFFFKWQNFCPVGLHVQFFKVQNKKQNKNGGKLSIGELCSGDLSGGELSEGDFSGI